MCGILLSIETETGCTTDLAQNKQGIIKESNDGGSRSREFYCETIYPSPDETKVEILPSSTIKGARSAVQQQTTVSWLKRRGPDHVGTYVKRIHYNSRSTEDNGTPNTSREAVVGTILFQASVLKMRDRLVTQPYPITKHGENDIRNDKKTCYLAWNGEIYQKIKEKEPVVLPLSAISLDPSSCESKSKDFNDSIDNVDNVEQNTKETLLSPNKTPISPDGLEDEYSFIESYNCEDVWQSSVSDTELVASLIQDKILNNPAFESKEHNDFIPIKLVSIISTLINAEYAFCLLTESEVYYGRDNFGRRSLLVGASQGTESEGSVQSWQLSSVAKKATESSVTTSKTEWTEVEPGVIFCYSWSKNTTKSYPLSAQVRIPTTTLLASTNTIEAASEELEALLFDSVRRRLGSSSKNQARSISLLFSGGLDSTVIAYLILRGLASTSDGCKTTLRLINVSFVNNCNPESNALKGCESKEDVSTLKHTDKADRRARNKSEKIKIKPEQRSETLPIAADTKAAQLSYQELKTLYPNHAIEFVQYVADWDTIQETEPIVRELMHPKSTLMDVNISTALWLAASQANKRSVPENVVESIGQLQDILPDHEKLMRENQQNKLIPSRILFTGLGADELMGGYGRHRKAWERGKSESLNNSHVSSATNISTASNLETSGHDRHRWDALRSELAFDVSRLWERNLGRDDRILSDHSLEVRLPFLDVHVVHFLRNICPIQHLVDYTMEPGIGDKRILRLIALRHKLYTGGTAVKRAIQFGSRISHVSDKQRFGSRRRATGDAQY